MHQRLKQTHEVLQQLLLTGFMLCLMLLIGCDDDDFKDNVRFNSGDSLTWASLEYDDSHWQRQGEDPEQSGDYFWIRWHISPQELEDVSEDNPGLWIGILAPSDFYWNGKFIGSNTFAGAPVESDSALVFTTLKFPKVDKNDDGNLLAVRMYKKTHLTGVVELELGNYSELSSSMRYRELGELILGIIYFVIAAFYIFFWASGETQFASRVFIALLLLASITSINDFLLHYLPIQADQLVPFYIFDLTIMFSIGIFIPAFLMLLFSYPKKWHLIPYALVVFVLEALQPSGLSLLAGVFAGFAVSVWALVKKKENSLPLFIGMLVCFLGSLIDGVFENNFMDFGFLFFIVIINIVLLKQIRQRRRDHQASLLRSARLEAQLLRKSIQPHYVLNSMNAVMDWIETEPDKGIEFLGALAEEFQVLSRISHKKEISVAEEIKICEAHLKIMSCRKEIKYSLATSNILAEEKIPPAIFHTLIENGVKYGGTNGSGVDFKIDRKQLPNGRSYSIFNSGEGIGNKKNKPDGTGMRYIKSRLEESYGQDWKLESHYREDGYECLIDIYDGGSVK